MLQDKSPSETPSALAAGSVAGAGSGPGDAAVILPGLPVPRWAASLPRLRVRVGPTAGRLALGAVIVATFAVVACAAAGPSILVPRSVQTFPSWEAGPLHNLFSRPTTDPQTLGLWFSAVLVAMFIAYLLVLGAVRTLPMRTIAIVVVLLHAILLLSPPLQLTDLFNYLGYARLGGLHHLNPYTHVIKQEFYDPVFRFSSWHNLKSPYGPLFTALTYPLAFLPLPVAYWIVKLLTVLTSLGFVGLIWHCARRLGRDPRYAVAFVALNPVFLIYGVAGFHNDFFMLVASMGAVALVLDRRDRSAGAALMIAIAVKYTAVMLLPFLLIGARDRRRALRILAGAAVAAVPMIAGYALLFGSSIPNLSDQSSLLTDFSIPNLFGLLIGIGGGASGLLKVATVAVVLVVAFEVWRRREWLTAAGWSTLALIASLAWLVPWYVIWLLPLAGLGTSARLRRSAVALTLFLVLAFMPATPLFLSKHGIDLLGSSVGRASTSRQHKLSQ
jgi:Glycosyltransferase family 87